MPILGNFLLNIFTFDFYYHFVLKVRRQMEKNKTIHWFISKCQDQAQSKSESGTGAGTQHSEPSSSTCRLYQQEMGWETEERWRHPMQQLTTVKNIYPLIIFKMYVSCMMLLKKKGKYPQHCSSERTVKRPIVKRVNETYADISENKSLLALKKFAIIQTEQKGHQHTNILFRNVNVITNVNKHESLKCLPLGEKKIELKFSSLLFLLSLKGIIVHNTWFSKCVTIL